MAPTIFSYDGQPAQVEGWPDLLPPGQGFNPVQGRSAQWREIDLCANVTNLGYGPAVWGGQPVHGFYFQATTGSAQQVADQVGLGVFQLGSLLFFAPEVPPPTRLLRGADMSLRARLVKLAWENPGLRGDLLPILASQDKTAITKETEAFIAWVLIRDKPISESDATHFLEQTLGRGPTAAADVAPPKRGPLEVGEWVRAEADKNANEMNTAACAEFDGQYAKIREVGPKGVTVVFESGREKFFDGHASGAKTGLLRGKPKSVVSEQPGTNHTGLECIYLSSGQHVPSKRDQDALARYIDEGLNKGQARSNVYYTGHVTAFAISKEGNMYFRLSSAQRERSYTALSAVKGKILYLGRSGQRPGGWKAEAERAGIIIGS